VRLVIFEDCSTDRTREIVLSHAARLPDTIHVVLSEHNRDFGKWAEAARTAEGEYLAVLDADDFWTSPRKLQAQVEFMDEHRDCAISFHDLQVVGKDSPYVRKKQHVYTFEDLLLGNFIPWSSSMYRLRIVSALPEWYESVLFSDWAFELLNARSGVIREMPGTYGVYRYHGRGVWSGMPRKAQIAELISFTEDVAKRFEMENAPVIKRALAEHWCSLAIQHRKEKNFREMVRCGRRALGLARWNARVALRLAAASIRG
jgi:glycosyltransferase involved in cell wall biosynthesis